MTKGELRRRVRDLMKQAQREAMVEALRLTACGAFDLDTATGGIQKAIVHVALRNISDGYRPLNTDTRAEAENLKHF